MTAIDHNRVRDVFLAAAELPAEGRNAFLANACGKDAELRAAIDRLLAAHAEPASILDPSTGQYVSPDPDDSPVFTESYSDQPDVGTILVGRYKFTEPIGEGGMGSVWMARQTEPIKRMVAVKLIKAGMDSKAVLVRFEAERQALALMDHPNIARVLDAGTTPDNRPFFVMELVKGVPITKYCDDRKLSTRQRLELFVPVCRAIQHAHQKGIIHRDIKPSNVLVAHYDDHAVPKVIDFGVAKATGQQLTEMTLHTGFGSVVGTLEYMSPEQATFNNLDIDTRSDVYALGVLLYELLTGSPPFRKNELEKAGFLEMLRLVREVDPPKPSTKVSTAAALPTLAANRRTEPGRLSTILRNELDWIVMKALEKDRARRYETANGLAMDVNRHLAGEAVVAVPPSAGYRVRKFVRKNRGPVIAAAMVSLALVAGVVGTTAGLLRAESARAAEESERLRAETALDAEATERWRADDLRVRAEALRAKADDEANRANAAATKAQLSMEAEKVAIEKAQRLLSVMNVHEGLRLLDGGDRPLGLLRIAHAMSLAPPNSEMQEITRMQFALHRQSLPDAFRLSLVAPHAGKAVPAAFSRDGRRILLGTSGKSMQIRDLDTGKPVSPPLVHSSSVVSAAASHHEQKFITGCSDGTVWIWNAESGKLISQRSLGGAVAAVAFTPKETRALAMTEERGGEVWNVDLGKIIARIPATNGSVRSAAFSPNGQRLLIGYSDNFARLWDAENGAPVAQPLSLHSDSVESVAFSPDGSRFLTGSKDQRARVWTLEKGRFAVSMMLEHPDAVVAAAFSPDGKSAITGCSDNLARVWGLEQVKPRVQVALPHAGPVESVSFSPHGRRVASVSTDGTARVWELSGNLETVAQPPADTLIVALAFSPNGRKALSGNKDGTSRLFDVDSPQTVTLASHTGAVHTVAFSNDSKLIATGSEDKQARVLDSATGKHISFSRIQDGPVHAIAFSPDGERLAVGNSFGSVLVWNLKTTTASSPPIQRLQHGAAVLSIVYSQDGNRIMTGGANKIVRVWDAESGIEKSPLLRHPDAIESVTFSPDGHRALTGCTNGTVRVFDLDTGRVVAVGPTNNSPVTSVAFSPHGRWALTGSRDGTVRVWDVETGLALSPALRRTGPIACATFSPEGMRAQVPQISKAPYILDLTPDSRPASNLLELAQLNSSFRIDGSDQTDALTGEESYALWTGLKAKYPEEFKVGK